MRGEVEETTRKEDDHSQKKRGQAPNSKLKGIPKKKTKIDEIGLGDSEVEEEALIKWQDYEIETLIIVHSEMKEEFTKLSRK